MIPKIIHYCWFGGNPKPELVQRCIESWKKYCPDYEIKEWNESNFDLNYNTFVKEAYQKKKWAFVADVARLHALVTVGGIYMDTDVELIRSLDDFLEQKAFAGFGSMKAVETGIMASEPQFPLFSELLKEYEGQHFIAEDGTLNTTANTIFTTNICLRSGLVQDNTYQVVQGLAVYPAEYFSPKDWMTRKINLTPNTAAIHHFDGSWLPEETRYRLELKGKLCRFLPTSVAYAVSKVIAVTKYRGVKITLKKIVGRMEKNGDTGNG